MKMRLTPGRELRRDAQDRGVIVAEASAEALFPDQPQFQPAPQLPLAAALAPAADVATEDVAMADGNEQVRRSLSGCNVTRAGVLVRTCTEARSPGEGSLVELCILLASSAAVP